MGQLRFIVPRPERVDDFALQRAYVAGLDSIPWVSCADWDAGDLIVEREIRESGNVFIPWQVQGYGELVLSTASLMERKQPYLLPLELARGTINRCRNYIANWQMAGMQTSSATNSRLREALTLLASAATGQGDALIAGDDAERAISLGLEAMDLLIDDYVNYVAQNRRQASAPHTTLMAGRLEAPALNGSQGKAFVSSFNTAAIALSWRDLEPEEGKFNWEPYDRQIAWCRDHGLKMIGGPLIRLDPLGVPDWLYLWVGDFEMLQSQIVRFVEAVVKRYHGKVHVWNAVAKMNVTDCLKLSEEERLRLTVDIIEIVRREDPRVPLIASFDQPWGEYLAREEMELSPIHFADTLVRSDLGLAGIGLEINYGYSPNGTYPRDLLDFGRLIDQWSALGLPLVLHLTAPSSLEITSPIRHASKPIESTFNEGPSLEEQSRFVERYFPFLLSMQAVQGIVWNQLRDSLVYAFPNGGVFDEKNIPKPILEALASVRTKFVG